MAEGNYNAKSYSKHWGDCSSDSRSRVNQSSREGDMYGEPGAPYGGWGYMYGSSMPSQCNTGSYGHGYGRPSGDMRHVSYMQSEWNNGEYCGGCGIPFGYPGYDRVTWGRYGPSERHVHSRRNGDYGTSYRGTRSNGRYSAPCRDTMENRGVPNTPPGGVVKDGVYKPPDKSRRSDDGTIPEDGDTDNDLLPKSHGKYLESKADFTKPPPRDIINSHDGHSPQQGEETMGKENDERRNSASKPPGKTKKDSGYRHGRDSKPPDRNQRAGTCKQKEKHVKSNIGNKQKHRDTKKDGYQKPVEGDLKKNANCKTPGNDGKKYGEEKELGRGSAGAGIGRGDSEATTRLDKTRKRGRGGHLQRGIAGEHDANIPIKESDINLELQTKGQKILDMHNKKIEEENKKLRFVLSVEATSRTESDKSSQEGKQQQQETECDQTTEKSKSTREGTQITRETESDLKAESDRSSQEGTQKRTGAESDQKAESDRTSQQKKKIERDQNNITVEKRNIEMKLAELTKQKDEFVKCMKDISRRLGDGTVGGDDAKRIRQSFDIECNRLRSALPMYARRSDIVESVKSQQVTIVLGETGSGKSTQIVQYLYHDGFAGDGLIVCTQPRKVAAVSLAEHVSYEMRSPIGGVVGYKKGSRGNYAKRTKILYMTDHALLMECIHDLELSQYSCVVIDEAHERSLYTDVLLGMLKKLLTRRKELRLIVSSATMDTELFRTYFADFDAKVLEVSGRVYPVEVIWPSKTWAGLSKIPVQDTVDKVKEIHRTEKKGDVLVFLTTPAETEQACGLLATNKDLECLPLHGKLQPLEQQKVFKQVSNGKRKVVFATNCAETSITIPGIKYVVDTGLVKENRFDPIKNMSTLDVGRTSRSSVEQRKGRAGRIEAGKCFRLFTEEDFKKMEASNKPEILRVQLSQAILSLMVAGVADPLQFDFVQSPGTETLEAAMADLVCVGAVKDGEVTDLGRKISKLQLSPRLGKLVIEGIEMGVAIEAMVVASNCTMTGSMFFRMGSEEEKQKADIMKLPFCNPAGDLVTCLDVYRAWVKVPEARRNSWCMNYYINAKTMRIIKDTVMELLRNMDQLGARIDRAFKSPEEADEKIQRCIFSCFKSNLSYYGGYDRFGYISCQEGGGQAGVLHPSSASGFLDQIPKWLVYDRILQTSQKFILNVTTVEEAWVMEEVNSGKLQLDLQQIEENMPAPTRMAEFGFKVMGKLREDEYSVCKNLEKDLAEKLQSPVVLEVVNAPCILTIIARKQHHKYIKEVVRECVRPIKEEIKAKEMEVAWQKTTTRLVFGRGYEVSLFLGEGEFRSILVKSKDRTPKIDVLDYFERFGKIVSSFTFEDQNPIKKHWNQSFRWGKITFSSRQEAIAAVRGTEEEDVFAIGDLNRGSQRRGKYLITFRYCRRESKGAGFVKFQTIEDAVTASETAQTLKIGASRPVLRFDKRERERGGTKVPIEKINFDTELPELKEAVNEALGSCSKTVAEVGLYREPANSPNTKPTTPVQIKAFRRDLERAIDAFVTPGKKDEYNIRICKIMPFHNYLFGTIHFKTFGAFEMVARRLPGDQKHQLKYLKRPLGITHEINVSFSLPKGLYDLRKDCFEGIGEAVKVDKLWDDLVRVNVQCDDVEIYKRVTRLHQEALNGDQISSESPVAGFMFTPNGEKWRQDIMKLSGTYIAVNKRNKSVSIHGTEEAKKKAWTHLELAEFLSEVEKSKPRTIPLQDETQPKGLMKKVVQTYGCGLEELKLIPCITEAALDFRKRLLLVRGNDAALDTVSKKVKELADAIGQRPAMPAEVDDDDDHITCCVCYTSFEGDYRKLYRLQICGHSYCLECLEKQIRFAQTSKDFPIMCCGEDCQEPLAIADVCKIFPRQNESHHSELQLASLESFVSKNGHEYKFCSTPDCQGVYRVTKDETATAISDFCCDICLCDTCTRCHKQHLGLTCNWENDVVEINKWVEADRKNRRRLCPRCKVGIEKKSGCNHMYCRQCKADFCWLCLKVFRSSGACYDHLSAVHGGFGLRE